MKSTLGLNCLALLIGLVLLAAPALAQSGPFERGAVDTQKAEALSLLKSGQADKAYELYSRLLREEPEDPEINLGLARSAASAGRHYQAVIAYERLLVRYPSERYLYEEALRSYQAVGDRRMTELMTKRMAQLATGQSRTEEDAYADLESQSREAELFVLNGRLRFGAIYDSNANLGPSSDLLNFEGWNGDVRVAGADGKASAGVYGAAALDMARRADPASPYWLVADVQLYVRGNFNGDLKDNTSREMQWGRLGLGFRRSMSDSMFDLRLKGEIYDYEFDRNITAVGPELLYIKGFTPDFQLILGGGLDSRSYSYDSGRDGAYGWVGPSARFYFGQQQHHALVGARYLGASTDRDYYDYNGWEAFTRFSFALPREWELAPLFSYTDEKYKGPASILDLEDRHDRRWRAGLALNVPLTNSWTLETSYQYTDNNSNSPLYDYRQNLVTAGVAYNF